VIKNKKINTNKNNSFFSLIFLVFIFLFLFSVICLADKNFGENRLVLAWGAGGGGGGGGGGTSDGGDAMGGLGPGSGGAANRGDDTGGGGGGPTPTPGCIPQCSLHCGQANGCNSYCTQLTCGDPSSPQNPLPNNSQTNPYIISSGSNINLSWNTPLQPNGFDNYALRVNDTATTWNANNCSESNNKNYCKNNIPSTTHSFTFPPTGYLIPGHTYHWWVDAYKSANCAGLGVCSTDNGFSPNVKVGGYFKYDPNFAFDDLVIKNSDGVVVLPDGSNRNQICETSFANRTVNFEISVQNKTGGGDAIKKINLDFLNVGTTYLNLRFDKDAVMTTGGISASLADVTTTTNVLGNYRTVNFTVVFDPTFPSNLYDLNVYSSDSSGNVMPGSWLDTGRNFKVWNCLVPIRGNIWQGNKNSSCSLVKGYSSPFVPTGTIGLSYDSNPMTFSTTTTNHYVNNGSDLVWGQSYNANFTGFGGINPSGMMTIDLGTGTTKCPSDNYTLTLDKSNVSPYTTTPSIRVDYTTVSDQVSWFQIMGGGINSKGTITDNVPGTCSNSGTCTASMTIDNLGIGGSNSGLVAGKSLENNSGCTSCNFGGTSNWNVSKNIIGEDYGYKYFYDRYYTELGQGTILTSWSDIKNRTGVVFVNGDLNIDSNNTIGTNQYLMVIVKGDINIDQSVNNISGIFVADGLINAGGSSDTQLIINGSLYSSLSNVVLNRSYITLTKNNTSPSVLVKYRPDFIFSLPGSLIKVLSGWKGGV
jgi:hypothetical protein